MASLWRPGNTEKYTKSLSGLQNTKEAFFTHDIRLNCGNWRSYFGQLDKTCVGQQEGITEVVLRQGRKGGDNIMVYDDFHGTGKCFKHVQNLRQSLEMIGGVGEVPSRQ